MKMVMMSLAAALAICMSPNKIAAARVKPIDLEKLCKKRGFKVTIVKSDRTGIYRGRFVGPGSFDEISRRNQPVCVIKPRKI